MQARCGERESAGSHDRLGEEPQGDTGPGPYDDDGDMSNVAVGAASPTWEAQSPIETGVMTGDGRQQSATAFGSRFPASADGTDDHEASTTSEPRAPMTGAGGAEQRDASSAAWEDSSHPSTARAVMVGGGPVAATAPARTLALSKHNLATFEDSVLRGRVPLRVDVIDSRHYLPQQANENLRGVEAHADPTGSVSVATNVAPGSGHDGWVPTLNANPFSSMDVLAVPPPALHSRGVEEAASTASTGGTDVRFVNELGAIVTADAAHAAAMGSGEHSGGGGGGGMGDRSIPRTAYPLSNENLQLHMRELTSGVPVPLTGENIGPEPERAMAIAAAEARPLSQRAGEESDSANRGPRAASRAQREMSILVEPSEASRSEVASTVDTSALRATLVPAALSDGNVEEMWSTVSTHGGDSRRQSLPAWTAGNALQSLSKKNLRQLRRQLESGETPLRPEVLASLSNVAKAMHVRSEKSPSMTVEVPVDELGIHHGHHHERTRLRTTAVRAASPPADAFDEGDGAGTPSGRRGRCGTDFPDEEVDLSGDLDDEDNGSLPFKSSAAPADVAATSDAGGTSFHSTMVEAPSRTGTRTWSMLVSDMLGVGVGSGGGAEGGGRGAAGTGAGGGAAVAVRASASATGRVERPATSAGRSRGAGGAVGASGGRHGDYSSAAMNVAEAREAGTDTRRARTLEVSADLGSHEHDRTYTVDGDDDEDVEMDKSTTALSQDDVDDEGRHDESMFMAEDDGLGSAARKEIVFLKRCLHDFARGLKATRQDQVVLSRQLQRIREELTPTHAGHGHVRAEGGLDAPAPSAIGGDVQTFMTVMRGELEEMRLRMREIQSSQAVLMSKVDWLLSGASDGLRGSSGARSTSPREVDAGDAHGPRSPHPVQARQRPRVRVIVAFDMALLSDTPRTGPSTVVSFLVPMSRDATVRDCREEFLRRLREQNPAAAAALPLERTVFEMDGHVLFDSLVLGADLHMDVTHPEGYSVTVRKVTT